MAEEVKELKEAVMALTKKVEVLSGLSQQVTEITSGVTLMREMFLRLEAGPSKKQKHKATIDNSKAEEEAETESNDGVEKEVGRYQKLDLPIFDGENPLGWFFRIERHFQVRGIIETEKLGVATICLEGRALNWYQWKDMRSPLSNWIEFKRKVLKHFHASQLGGEYCMLFVIKQESSVLEYVEYSRDSWLR